MLEFMFASVYILYSTILHGNLDLLDIQVIQQSLVLFVSCQVISLTSAS